LRHQRRHPGRRRSHQGECSASGCAADRNETPIRTSQPRSGGAAIFQRLYYALGCRGRPPRFEVEFYPYANLMHTIRLREEGAHVRLSDALRGGAARRFWSPPRRFSYLAFIGGVRQAKSFAPTGNLCFYRELAGASPHSAAFGAAVSNSAPADRFTIWRPCLLASTGTISPDTCIAPGSAGAAAP